MDRAESRGRLYFGASVAAFVALILWNWTPGSGFTRLAGFGEYWEDRRTATLQELDYFVKPGSFGYDGQFYAQIAFDPLLRDEDFVFAIDAPAYRARRILLPAVAWLMGLGRPEWILQVYSVLNVLLWPVLGWQMFRLLPAGESAEKRFLRWFAVMFSVGVLDSVALSLTDLPMLVLLTAAVSFWRSGQVGRGAGLLSLALLARETALLGLAGRGNPMRMGRAEFIRWAGWAFLAVLPLAAWCLYVLTRFEPYGGVGGNIGIPFHGVIDRSLHALRELGTGNWDSRYVFGIAAVVGFFSQLSFLLLRREPRSHWWRIGIAYGLLLVFLGVEPWRGYWAVARIILPMTVAFNLMLPAGRSFWAWWIVGNATFVHGVIRLI